MQKTPDTAYRIGLLLVLVAAATLPYLGTLECGFYFDDTYNITKNKHIRVTELTFPALWDAAFRSTAANRPIANLTVALNYYFGRYNPVGYHLFNVAIHALTTLLVFAFSALLLLAAVKPARLRWPPREISAIAAATALLWCLHPIQTQAVTYIIQRMASMATMFYLLGLALYLAARLRGSSDRCGKLLIGSSVVAWLAAMGCKEIAVTWPILVLLIEWYFFQDLDPAWPVRALKYWLPALVIIVVAALVYSRRDPFAMIAGSYKWRDFTMSERLLTEARIVVFYLSLLAFPHPARQNLDHLVPLSRSLLDPLTTLGSVLAIVALLVVAAVSARRQRLLSLCLLWYFLNLALESSFIGLELIFEHRLYLPSVAVFLLLSMALFRLLPAPQSVKMTVLVAGALLLGGLTWQRNKVWRDQITLWQDVLAKNPSESRPLTTMGVALMNVDRVTEALPFLEAAVEKQPSRSLLRFNYGVGLQRDGQFAEAVTQYRAALDLRSEYPECHLNLGSALLDIGELEAGYVQLQLAEKLVDEPSRAHYHIGRYWQLKGELERSAAAFAEAAKLDPTYVEARSSLAALLLQLDRPEAAVTELQAAVAAAPQDAKLRDLLGYACYRSDQLDGAIDSFRVATELSPETSTYWNNYGLALKKAGRREEAIDKYRHAIELAPAAAASAHNNLGSLLRDAGKTAEALAEFEQALVLAPTAADAGNNRARVLSDLGRLTEARQAYEQVLAHHPANATARAALQDLAAVPIAAELAAARRQLQAGATTAAVAALQAIVAKQPDYAEGQRALGDAMMQLRRTPEAVSAYEAALQGEVPLATVHNNLGAAYGQLGNLNKAVEHFRAAIAADPEHTDAKHNLEAALKFMEQQKQGAAP